MGMRVEEYLYETVSKVGRVRVWYADFDQRQSIVATIAEEGDSSPWILAGHLAALPSVNAVQVTFSDSDSFLIYPDWP